VEDDEDDVVLLNDMMHIANATTRCKTVNNGFEAITFLQGIKQGQAYPCLILMDIQMPRLNGRETLEFLKSDDLYCLIPVLMFSESQDPEYLQYFSQMRTEVLAKPGNFNSWKETIRKINSYME
jgi:CheY-like chemotaxis protein